MTQDFIEDVVAKVKSDMGIPPCFIDRGDPAAPDFVTGHFAIDNAWHNLDLSGIVPANAAAILFISDVKNTNLGVNWDIRKKGNTNLYNVFRQYTQGNNIFTQGDGICPIDTTGLLEYLIIPVGVWFINFTVKGWWL